MMRIVLPLLSVGACAPLPVSPEQAAEFCEERARAAQGPTGGVTVGASSDGGAFGGVEIGLSSDFLAGRNPLDVFTRCVFDRTGQAPVRAPVLR